MKMKRKNRRKFALKIHYTVFSVEKKEKEIRKKSSLAK